MLDDWKGVLRAITAPVILFGLFILVLGSVAISVTQSSMEPSVVPWALLGIGILTCLELFMVFILVIFYPTNLMFSGAEHLAKKQMDMGTKESPKSKARIGQMERKEIRGSKT